MVGITLREEREERGWARKVIAFMANVSESLVSEWEHGRRRISDALKPVLARKLDSGKLCMALKSEATGGIMAAPYLDGKSVDNHRLVCVERTIEEMDEATEALRLLRPVLLMPPGRVEAEGKVEIEKRMMQVVQVHTAVENTLTRVAREYDISLAGLYDRHQVELIEKGFLEKEKTAHRRAVI